jgi:hypothetical protein
MPSFRRSVLGGCPPRLIVAALPASLGNAVYP